MSTHLPPQALAFLRDLEANNTKEWFAANKSRYERELKAPARALVHAVNERIRAISPAHASDAPHKLLNRINRDIRFSKDKSPYNTRLWAGFHNTTAPKGEGAGFYFGLSPHSCGVGAGVWEPPNEAMTRLRARIASDHAALTDAIAALPKGYGELGGDKYKRVPAPWPADHPAGELLKHKGMHIRIELPAEAATSPDFADVVAAHFRHLQPIVAFLDAGLSA